MHAMRVEALRPVHKPRRLTFRRMLLALVLGLSAWWGVGWWLAPRPLYTLRYPDSVIIKPGFISHLHGVAPFDRDGRMLVVKAPRYGGGKRLDIIDLASGK